MVYFRTNYKHVAYPPSDQPGGLYNAQIGAIHALASHFTLRDEPAVITMPTGSGKTAVLMMAPFVLRATRVLVITPSRLVREQIAEDLRSLETLRKATVIPNDVPSPKVFELKERIESVEQWEVLRHFDVVVSTPNCASSAYQYVPPPPDDLFDLLLIDEAHHTAAATWKELLDSLKHIRTALFTATPFRRDRGEIPGRFVYSYPLAKAYADKIFGQIEYVPVNPVDGVPHDVSIAKAAEAVFKADRAKTFDHYVMVRTDSLKRSAELADIYANNTDLTLRVINSKLSSRTVKAVLEDLRAGRLDGIICVNMLGEGFNFPKLKIGAIHSPHKSLENTLQFIGRFARTNAPDIGSAKFVAVPSEIEIEGQQLFKDGAVWQDLIIGLSHGKIAEEVGIRETLQSFAKRDTPDEDLSDLSLYSLYPRPHVKIYDVDDEPDLHARLNLPTSMEIAFRTVNEEGNAAVLLTKETVRPKWADGDRIVDVVYDLVVMVYDKKSKLLFINCSRTIEGLYELLATSVSKDPSPLPTSLVKRVTKDITNTRVFNLGMRNIQATNRAESYRISAGSDTQNTIKPSDARMYRQGHAFLTGETNGQKITIGYSSASKVWGSAQMQIPQLLKWCRVLGEKIRSVGDIITNSRLDFLSAGEVVAEIPSDVVYVRPGWDAFDYNSPVLIRYTKDDGAIVNGHILDLDFVVDMTHTDAHKVRISINGDGLDYQVDFTLDDFCTAVNGDDNRVQVIKGGTQVNLIEYLNSYYLEFFTANGSLFTGNELYTPKTNARPIADTQLQAWGWDGVDISNEATVLSGTMNVHARVRKELEGSDADVIIYDHGSGEVADFISLEKRDGVVRTVFYHCKGSGTANPGARVEDLYEVCGQAQKSIVWVNLQRLVSRMQERRGAQYIRGSFQALVDLVEEAKTLEKRFEVALVQPGLSRGKLTAAIAENLGATSDHVVGAGCEPLRVIIST